jgi:ParB family chromosome partitioning protein
MDGSTNTTSIPYTEEELSIADITTRANNRTARNVEQLAEAIQSKGLLNRVLVRRRAGKVPPYELIAGERRLRAHQLLGLQTIAAKVYVVGDAEAFAPF